jgi:hypothetical protein
VFFGFVNAVSEYLTPSPAATPCAMDLVTIREEFDGGTGKTISNFPEAWRMRYSLHSRSIFVKAARSLINADACANKVIVH